MITRVTQPGWINILVLSIFFFDDTFAVSLRRNEMLFNDPDNLAEPGFDLNEEDMTKFHIWPKGIIPYYIDDFSFDKVLRDRLRMFLDGVNKLTILHFLEMPKPPEDEKFRWVLFVNRKGLLGCADHAFKNFINEGVQRVVLGYHCLSFGENLADIVLSLVGVSPQHNSPDRDQHVTIMEDNIVPDKLYLFEIVNNTEWLFHNLTYDIESAGHFDPYMHTSNGKVTVLRKNEDYYISGPPLSKSKKHGFSSKDLLKIAMLYNYISRNRETPVPECSKLFLKSNNPTGRLTQKDKKNIKKIEPREKPSQYLGIPEKENVAAIQNNERDIEKDTNVGEDNKENYSEEINHSNNKSTENKKTLAAKETINDNRNYYYDDKEDTLNNIGGDDHEIINNKKKMTANIEIVNNHKINVYNGSKDENIDVNTDYSKNKVEENEKTNIEKLNENNDQEDNETNENINVSKYDGSSKRIVNTSRETRLNLKLKVNSKSQKLKLLGQSDYETGDEFHKNYIHEKNL